MFLRPDLFRPGRVAAGCLLLVALLLPASGPAQTSLRVLDYNIHRDVGSSSSNISAQASLAKVVNFLNPDVWTINELGGDTRSFSRTTAQSLLVTFIQSNLTIFGPNPTLGIDFFVHVGSFSDGFIGNAIVSRYPFLATQSYSDAGSGYSALRGLAFGYVDVPGDTDVGVFTAHLKALSGDDDAQRRQAEAEANRATIAGWLSGHPGEGAIMAGDFNASEDVGDTSNWSGHSIGDTLPNGQIYRPITTLRQAGLLDAAPVSIRGDSDTISSTSPTARFDYLLYTGSTLSVQSSTIFDTRQYTAPQLAALNTANGTTFVSGDSATASDHLPVFGVFTVVPEPGAGILLLFGMLSLGRARLHPRRSDSHGA